MHVIKAARFDNRAYPTFCFTKRYIWFGQNLWAVLQSAWKATICNTLSRCGSLIFIAFWTASMRFDLTTRYFGKSTYSPAELDLTSGIEWEASGLVPSSKVDIYFRTKERNISHFARSGLQIIRDFLHIITTHPYWAVWRPFDFAELATTLDKEASPSHDIRVKNAVNPTTRQTGFYIP
jgi:hypothetical protein